MAILDLTFPRGEFQDVEDYETIINRILALDVKFTILKFNLSEDGIDVKIEVPDGKLASVKLALEKNSIKIKRQVIDIEEELCVDCGACIALCNTGALFFDEDFKRQFAENKCVGCKLCVDACPRNCISFK